MSYSFLITTGVDATCSIPVGNAHNNATATLKRKNSSLTSTSIVGGKATFTIPKARVNEFAGDYTLTIDNKLVQRGEITLVDTTPDVSENLKALVDTKYTLPVGGVSVNDINTTSLDALYTPATTSNQLRVDSLQTVNDQNLSRAKAAAAHSDSTTFVESWSNLNAWTPNTASNASVSNGKLYSTGAGANSGLNHSWSVSATGRSKIAVPVTLVAGGTAGSVIVGVSNDTAGAAPSGGVTFTRGIQFSNASSTINKYDGNNGTVAATSIGTWTAGTWNVIISVDENGLSIVAVAADGSKEVQAKWTRAQIGTINNITVFNSDSRTTTGHYINPLVARSSLSSTLSAEMSTQRTVVWNSINGNNIRIAFPPNYDSRIPAPVVLYTHGSTGNELSPAVQGGPTTAVANALNAAGCIVASTVGKSAAASPANPGDEWGNQSILDSVVALYRYIRDRYAIGPVVIWGQSMGGLAALLTTANHSIPGIAAVMLNEPVCSLSAAFTGGTFGAGIKDAYNLAANGSDYASKTAGHDPMLFPPAAYRGIPMWLSTSNGDTYVPPADHVNKIVTKLTDPVVYMGTGQHGDVSMFPATAQANWLKLILGL